ncbi:MAG: glycosyltransferase family 4 protein [Candidatus Magasanikbacteria bacterium]|jgi:glycosyltransferase involved in cell wall biosynthesis|nr:glycosyltransferase family 4 protein [Candidatus Magasanikbacteria bacterium]MBT4071459.1 glycosyltransferase family 4 protein [Candidatus Magasanikbacteria bacterium]
MRIAMIGQKGMPAVHGGVERHVHDLSVRLKKEGMDVSVYSRLWYSGKKTKTVDGVKTIFTPSIKTKHLDAITHTFFSTIHAMFSGVNVIHYHGVGPSLLAWIPRIFSPRVRVISTFHSIDRKHKKWNWFARIMLHLGERASCTFAHKTIAVSQTIQQYARDAYDCHSIFIPNAVNMPEVGKADHDILNTHNIVAGNYVLAVSRFIPHKAMHNLIAAWDILEKKGNTHGKQLVIVGGGHYTDAYVDKLHRLAKDSSSIIFTGFQSGDALATLFSNANLFVNPSLNEGLPIVVLEAMSYGLPLVLSDIPEHTYLISDPDALFQAGSEMQLAFKLNTYLQLSSEILEEKGKKYKKIIQDQYTWDMVIGDIIDVYNKK